MLYPFKLKPILLPKIWGGQTIKKWYDNVPAECDNVGEAWVMSDFGDLKTEVANGSHTGDDLQDLLEVYMDELVGEKVYERFENRFPLLLKFIDAANDLSVQVHPDDEYALEHDHAYGKTEMWYVMPSQGDASIFLGWKQQMNASLIHAAIAEGKLTDYLKEYHVHEGNVAFLPPGTVHALRGNTIVAEIQENSDSTYRLYDYNRIGADGKKRPLHLDKSLQVLNLAPDKDALVAQTAPRIDGAVNLRQCSYFTANLLALKHAIQRDYAPLDSFVAYMCVEGSGTIEALDCETEDKKVTIQKGEAVLIPASLNDIVLTPQGDCKLLEIYIDL